jgi:Cys-tRNA(Pro)/Cys-tRNA(Cys) deacylase
MTPAVSALEAADVAFTLHEFEHRPGARDYGREAADAIGVERAELCDPQCAERATGYVVGGISPFGQRKRLATVIDETCELYDTIYVSGGRRGLDLGIAPADLVAVTGAIVDAITA